MLYQSRPPKQSCERSRHDDIAIQKKFAVVLQGQDVQRHRPEDIVTQGSCSSQSEFVALKYCEFCSFHFLWELGTTSPRVQRRSGRAGQDGERTLYNMRLLCCNAAAANGRGQTEDLKNCLAAERQAFETQPGLTAASPGCSARRQ